MIRRHVQTIVLLFLCNLIGKAAYSQENYPIPAKDDKLQFYFQRSCNTNTIVYELNTMPDGNINKEKPVVAHWILYDKGGIRENLSFIQRRAFGLEADMVDKRKENFELHFYCYKKRTLYLIKYDNKYKVCLHINGELAELCNLFIKCENNALGFPIIISYVLISGKDLKNGNAVTEKLIP